ncbi:MAG TPA: gfo/Idh/MocA family oxidoreductase, partial [Firmicutes bacterium]|nr:gfo/Idh/MocA family oxidoreductase [Bacillota bacterium]
MERTIGFGIIGCGTIAPWHADSVARIEGARLVAVSDVVEEAARKMGQKYQANWYTDYQKILEREDVDVVCVLT